MRYQFFCTAGFIATLLFAHAQAQPAPHPQDCTGKPGVDWKVQIKACTALIEATQGSPQERAKAYKSRASAYSYLNDLDRAMADDDAAIRLDPNFAAAYGGRGAIYLDRDDPDRAIAEYDQALQHDAKYIRAYIGRSNAYGEKGDFDRALAEANEAIRLDPHSADAYESRGEAYLFKGDIERALADFDEAIRLDPKGAASTYNDRGLAYMQKGDFASAITAFSEAVRRIPQAIGYSNRGRAYLFAGALPKAIDDFKQALAMAPANPHNALWLDIAEARNKMPSTLPEAIAKFNMKAWPAPVVRMYLGQMKPAAVLAATADDPSATTKANHVCEANLFAGEWELQQGAKDDAVRWFRVAVRDCPKSQVEANAAALELKRLGTTP